MQKFIECNEKTDCHSDHDEDKPSPAKELLPRRDELHERGFPPWIGGRNLKRARSNTILEVEQKGIETKHMFS